MTVLNDPNARQTLHDIVNLVDLQPDPDMAAFWVARLLDLYNKHDTIMNGNDKAATKARKEMREGLTAAAPILAHKPFFMSEEFSLVDASIAPLLWRLPMLGLPFGAGTWRCQVDDLVGNA